MTREEAIKEIRSWAIPSKNGREVLETLIPELVESEDERVRRELIEFIQWSVDRHFMREDFHQTKRPSEWIAYLEKQKEQDNEEGDFTIYHPQKNGEGKYKCIPFSFYGSLTSFSNDKDLMDFLNECFYDKEECERWCEVENKPELPECNHKVKKDSVFDYLCESSGDEKQKEQKPIDYPYLPGWRKNRDNNKPELKRSVLMLTTHGVAEGEWLGEKWCQYRWSCELKDGEVLYWIHLSDLERLEKECEEKQKEQKPAEWSEVELEFRGEKVKVKRPFFRDDKGRGYSTTKQDEEVAWNALRAWCEKKGISLYDLYPKAEWSEEDADILNCCISSIEEAKENRYAYKETDGDTSYDREIAWLKSLRSSWKPSEEQMEVDLEKEIEQYLLGNADFLIKEGSKNVVQAIARHFAEWQKSQMMKEAVEGEYDFYPAAVYLDVPIPRMNHGDKVRVIVIPNTDEK